MHQRINTLTQQIWLAKLIRYDFEIIYKKGFENIMANGLSREFSLIAISVMSSELWDMICASYQDDERIAKLIKQMQRDPKSKPHYTWRQNCLKRKGKVIVGDDPELKQHLGVKVTKKIICNYFYWRGSKEAEGKFIMEYETRQRYKGGNTLYAGLLQPLPPH